VTLVGRLDSKKNTLVRFRHEGRDVVLKVYRQSLRYTLDALRNPLSRWGSRALALRSLPRARIRSEIECNRAFRAAGFGAFEILAQPSPAALLFRFEAGDPLRSEARDPAKTRELVVRASEELGRRQSAALERSCLWLVHPAPRLKHVFVTPDERLLSFDFEDRVNPSLRLEEALALELISWLSYLGRFEPTAGDDTLAACLRAVGEPAIARMRHYASTRRRGSWSGSFRKRRGILARQERLLAVQDRGIRRRG
jgi:hypothetical protein